jgi:hypothetical protein
MDRVDTFRHPSFGSRRELGGHITVARHDAGKRWFVFAMYVQTQSVKDDICVSLMDPGTYKSRGTLVDCFLADGLNNLITSRSVPSTAYGPWPKVLAHFRDRHACR